MATTKQTSTTTGTKTTGAKQTAAKKTTAKQAAAKRATAKAKAAAAQKQRAIGASIAVFAFGLLFVVMLFVPGAAAWAALRAFLFGVFGAGFYFLGVALLYLAVLVARQEPWLAQLLKILLGMAVLSGIAILFSNFDVVDASFGQAISAYYQNGVTNLFGGGVMGLVFGGSLLAICGRPAANIFAIILFVCALMLLTGITPAEIVAFVEARFNSAKKHGEQAKESLRASQEQRMEARERRAAEKAEENARLAAEQEEDEYEGDEYEEDALEEEELAEDETPNDSKKWFKLFARQTAPQAEEPQPETPKASPTPPRAPYDIALGPDPVQVKQGESEPIEPINIGPGGTFGLEAVRGVASIPAEETITKSAQPAAGEIEVGAEAFWQVPIVETGVASVAPASDAPVQGAGGASAAAVTQPVPTARATPAAQDGWISMGEEPATDSPELEHLVAAAMDKPKLADAAIAGTATAIPVVHAYQYPPIHLFDPSTEKHDPTAEAELKANAQKLVDTLDSFGVKTRVLDISRGPSVTRYELQPLAGVKISRITNLSDDIALNLSVAGVRIEAPIPGKPAVGIEVPNRNSSSVAMRSILESKNYTHMESPLTFALGKDIAGVAQVADLCKMPHLLVAGSTGSGKSVCVNSVIMSFLFRASPEDVKLILIDPKVVELAEYNGIPHLLMPVVTEPRKAAGALGSAVAEMEKRYRLFADNNVRDIKTYNKLVQGIPGMEKLPYIAIVIDELADLMMVSGKEVEDYICRIAQKARAAGMHLIVATQRPSVDVITGLIKANIPSRISFAVSSQIDSRTILDAGGAEKLLGMGDMLFMPVGASKPVRIQGTYVKDEEISRVLSFLKKSGASQYDEDMIAEMEKVAANQKGAAGAAASGGKADENAGDPMLKQCAEVIIEAGQASTSLLQRRCKLGYARAARIMDELEQLHIIGPYEGAKPRAVLVSRQQWLEMCMNEADAAQEGSTTSV